MIRVTYHTASGLATIAGPGGFTQLRIPQRDAVAIARVLAAEIVVRGDR